ncbi:Ig-like domain-containing protein [Pontimicrobium sp. MEBiC06410]
MANNTVSISLVRGITTENDFEISDPITETQYDQLIDLFHNSQFDINNTQEMEIPITFHLVTKSDFTGNTIPGGRISELIDRFNTLFSEANLNFIVCDIKTINDTNIYDINSNNVGTRNEILNTHNVTNTLNIYFVNEINGNSGINGYHTNFSNNITDDFVVIKNDRTSDEWATSEHEVGHYFGLIHTHGPSNTILTYELVNGNVENRETTGDLVADTAPDPKLTRGFIVNNNCEYTGDLLDRANDPFILNEQDVSNIMSYGYARPSGNDCRAIFTNGQMINVANYARNTRSYLDNSNCQSSGNSTISLSGNINFSNTQINTTSSQMSFTITNSGDENFNVSGITSSNNNIFTIVNPQTGVITPTGEMTIYVTFNPTQVQSYDGTITIENNADSTISLTGTGIDNNSGNSTIQITPNNINFNDTQINTTSSQMSFTITNTGNSDFNVTNITSSNNNIFNVVNPQTGIITPSNDMTIYITFNPTQVQNYNETITIGNNADNGSGTVSLSGNGVDNNNTGNSDLKIEDIWFDEESNGNWEINTRVKNVGNESTPNNEVINIRYYVNGNQVGSDEASYPLDVNEDDTEYLNDYEFPYNGNHTVEVVVEQVSNEVITSNNSMTISFDNSGSGGNNSITPADSCNSAPTLQLNTEYDVNIDVADYGASSPIDGQSSNGENVRGFWVKFNEPSGFVGDIDIKITDVSNNFDPVIGHKFSCGGIYYTQWNQSSYVANSNSYGGSETFADHSENNGYTHYVRIYHYYGNETPNISFKIKIEQQ